MEQPKKYPGSDYQELFDHLLDEHGLILLESQMHDIIHIVNKMQVPDRESELIEMLEKLRSEIGKFEKEASKTAEQFEKREMLNSSFCSKAMVSAYKTCNSKIDSLIQSVKQPK